MITVSSLLNPPWQHDAMQAKDDRIKKEKKAMDERYRKGQEEKKAMQERHQQEKDSKDEQFKRL